MYQLYGEGRKKKKSSSGCSKCYVMMVGMWMRGETKADCCAALCNMRGSAWQGEREGWQDVLEMRQGGRKVC